MKEEELEREQHSHPFPSLPPGVGGGMGADNKGDDGSPLESKFGSGCETERFRKSTSARSSSPPATLR